MNKKSSKIASRNTDFFKIWRKTNNTWGTYNARGVWRTNRIRFGAKLRESSESYMNFTRAKTIGIPIKPIVFGVGPLKKPH
jgi:hypothetical protein